jgi:hypothetical protein
VVVRLRDVLWVPGGCGVEVPDPHARRITDATVEEMPQINWDAAALAATYRGMCTKTGTQSILLGCPLLLHLWSYERLRIGRPSVD